MNSIDFVRLIYTIYGAPTPDLELIQRLGLLAIKIGQVHALRIDLLSENTCNELTRLYRGTKSIPSESLDELLALYAGSDYLERFSQFDLEPFASASIGQVHRAMLTTGETVAVKVVKKNFTDSFEKDVASVIRLFKIALLVYPKLRGVANPISLLKGIQKTTLAELDLKNEISGHQQLQAVYNTYKDQFDLRALRFARLYPEYSNKHILVSEFLTGPTVDELLQKNEFSYEQMLQLFKIQGFFMFVAGVFHGDIHPGNIVYQDNSFYFLDTGYIGSVSDQLRINLFTFFEHLAHYDYAKCAIYLNKMATVQIKDGAYIAFEKKFLELYSDFDNATVSQVSLTKRMMQTIKLGVKSGMEFEEGMFDIIKSLMYMDGMVLRCNPNAILMQDMRPFIQSFKQHL